MGGYDATRFRGKRRPWFRLAIALSVVATVAMTAGSGPTRRGSGPRPAVRPAFRANGHGPLRPPGHRPDGPGATNPADVLVAQGMQTFRYDTFGDEAFWGGALRLHEAVATLSPRQVPGLGLKVDSDALPADLRQQLQRGRVNLDDPAVTLALLRRNAVVGVTGFFSADGRQLRSIGIQCALRHSVVDDSLAPASAAGATAGPTAT